MGQKAISYLLHSFGVVFTLLLLLAAALSWRASFFSPLLPEWGDFWMAVALLMPIILLLNLAVFVWWLIRGRWGLMLIPIVAIVLNMNYITAMVQLPNFDSNPCEPDVRVMSLNVHGFRYQNSIPISAQAITYFASREKIDVMCLQEFSYENDFNVDAIASLVKTRMPYFAHGRGLAIFSHYPILDHQYKIFPETNNGYMWADLEVEGHRVRVFSVHLQTSGISSLRNRFRKYYNRDIPVDKVVGSLEHNSRVRAEQVDEIRHLIDSTRGGVIVTGDFNDTPSSYAYRRMKGDLTDGFRESGSGFGGTFRYIGGFLRIDYIFYNDTFEGVRYVISDEQVSDHKAVVADLRFREQ